MTEKKILDVRQQGKYFWLVMDSKPHPLMHFGMSGWMKFSNDESAAYYRPAKAEEAEWPPRFWKFVLQLKEDPKTEVAFVDPRRLGRIRLVDVEAEEMRKTTPLKENGPDPVIDKDILTVDWLSKKLRSKKVPVKALLLDQGMHLRGRYLRTRLTMTQQTFRVSAIGLATRLCTRLACTLSNTATRSVTSRSSGYIRQ